MSAARWPTESLAVLATIGLLAACAGRSDDGVYGEWVVERDERGDTAVVRTVAGSLWRDTMVMVAELTIGVLEGQDPYILGQIRALAVDAAGRIAVADGQAREVRLFSADGEHLRTIGRPGDGPGEFRVPDYLRFASDGRLVVRDQQADRYSVFSAEGEYLGGWRLQSGFSSGSPFFLDPGDRVWHPTIRNLGATPSDWQSAFARFQIDGTPLDTLDAPTRGFSSPRLEVQSRGGGFATYSIPFMPAEVWTVTRDGQWVFGNSERYRADVWAPAGRVLRIEREAAPVPVVAGEAAQMREQVTRNIRRANDPDWRWRGPDVPSVKPAFRWLAAGEDGTIWVVRQTPAFEVENPDWDPERPDDVFPMRWVSPLVADVFDEEGRFLGPVKVPERVQLLNAVMTRDRVWAVATHEGLGYPQVVRFRLEPQRTAATIEDG